MGGKGGGWCYAVWWSCYFIVAIQMQQLESRHKSELANHFRAQEKELEQLRINYERELERLQTRQKTEMDQRVGELCHLIIYPIIDIRKIHHHQSQALLFTTVVLFWESLIPIVLAFKLPMAAQKKWSITGLGIVSSEKQCGHFS